ncbi:MAG TPA: hypothetical protein VNG51_25800 [Ktedonobacteraceae bacterium]|nr:hypothetical protein [Ktedonobacteraceae bacterium]
MKIGEDVRTHSIVTQQVEQTTGGTSWTAIVTIALVALCTCAFVFCFLVSAGVLHYINQLENLSGYGVSQIPARLFSPLS